VQGENLTDTLARAAIDEQVFVGLGLNATDAESRGDTRQTEGQVFEYLVLNAGSGARGAHSAKSAFDAIADSLEPASHFNMVIVLELANHSIGRIPHDAKSNIGGAPDSRQYLADEIMAGILICRRCHVANEDDYVAVLIWSAEAQLLKVYTIWDDIDALGVVAIEKVAINHRG